MKKFFLFAALALSLPVFAQHSRRVLLEEFTQASCGPCAANNPSFNATLAQREDIITPIKYQTSWPGFDPMNLQNPSEVATRVSYYGVQGVPDAWESGTVSLGVPGGYTTNQIDDAYTNLTPVTMTATHNINSTLDTVFTTITVTSDVALTGTLRLRVAVVEDEILFNKAPGTNGEKEFYQIMRKMLPNAAGTATGDFAAGETKTYSFAWKLAYIYNLNEVGVSAWLQDDATKEVWQSARSLPNSNIAPLGINIESGNKLACAENSTAAFKLTNTAATALTSAKLRYRVGTATVWTPFDWTGNIAGGESQEVTLTGVTLPNTGLTKIEVEALESNNGVQTNMVGAVSTINYKVLTASATLPLAADFQTVVLPATWTAFNSGTNGWKASTPGSGSTRSVKCNMFDIPAGDDTYLISPKMDMSAASNTSTLLFDHAYTYYDNTFFDSLRIEVSTNCGNTWETVFNDGYIGLATAPAKTTAFTPTASQWQAGNAIDMTSYNGNAEVLIRFVGVSGYGNNLFLDNINLSTSVGVQPLVLNGFKLQPNPTQDLSRVSFNLPTADDIQVSVFNATGVLVQTQHLGNLVSGTHNVDLDATRFPSGSYRVVLQGNAGVAQLQWVVIK